MNGTFKFHVQEMGLLPLDGNSTLLYFSLTALGRGLNDRVQILVVFVYDSKHHGADS